VFAGRRQLIRFVATAAVVVAFTLLNSPTVFAQGNYGWLKTAPVSHFTAEDLKLMKDAAAAVLDSTEGGATRSWQNAATGNSGVIREVSRQTDDAGRDCRRLRVDNRAKNMNGSSTYTVCRAGDGTWQIDHHHGQ
jgi:hypothetical protein